MQDKTYWTVRDHCHWLAAHRILRYSVPKKTPPGFHNGSSYDYEFIIKEWAKEFEKKITCLPLWIYGQLAKVQWNIIISKRRFLQSLKYWRYYLCRIQPGKRSL